MILRMAKSLSRNSLILEGSDFKMESLVNKYKCGKCSRTIEREDLRIDLDGNRYICNVCFDLMKKQREALEAKSKESEKPVERVRLICVSCRYKFSLNKGTRVVPSCPYCGNNKVIKDELKMNKVLSGN